MSDAERVRALLAQAAAVGPGGGIGAGGPAGQVSAGDPLRGLLQAIDATILPRRLTLTLQATDDAAPQGHPGNLAVVAAGRRLQMLARPVPGCLGAEAGAVFDVPLDFDDAARMAEVAGVLASWADAARGWAIGVREDRLDSETAFGAAPGIAATVLADLADVGIWPDRSLAARLEAWMPAACNHAVAGSGYGALAGAEMAFGDPDAWAALSATVARLAPHGVERALATALARSTGGGILPGLVALSDADGKSLVIAGAPDAGLVALAPADAVPALARAWQRA